MQHGAGTAGEDFLTYVPAGARWRIRAFHVQFVTSATVAARELVLDFFTPGGRFAACPARVEQAAGLTWLYTFAALGRARGRRGEYLVGDSDSRSHARRGELAPHARPEYAGRRSVANDHGRV